MCIRDRLTYPRTDSQFITEDMESTAHQVIGIVSRKLPLFEGITHEPYIGRITNNAKVTDHQMCIRDRGRNGQAVALNYKVEGCKPKDMIGIPWMLALSLRDSGWYLRNDIIWMKENPMPERCV